MQRTVAWSLVVVAFGVAHAQPADTVRRTAYGVYGGVNFNMHTADFRALPGVPNCCPDFASGSGVGVHGGALYLYPFSPFDALEFRVGVSTLNAQLSTNEATVLNDHGAAVPGTFQHTVNASIFTLGIEPFWNRRVFDKFTVLLGARIAAVLAHTYDQREELTDPSTGSFSNGSRIRNDTAGAIPYASGLYAALAAGIAYELPVNKKETLILRPEVMYNYALTPVVTGLAWHANAFRAGLSLLWRPSPAEQEHIPLPPTHSDVPSVPLTASVRAVVVDSTGRERTDQIIRAEEYVSNHLHPLLNYIFFSEASSELAPRYVRLSPPEREQFREKQLHNTLTLPIYYQLLNIVGRRMTDNFNAVLHIVGCRTETGKEQNDGALTQRRAETVRNYLRDTWHIEEKRLLLESRGLPEKSANEQEQDGVDENRRVELLCDNPKILTPVMTRDTLRQVTPPLLRLRPLVTPSADVRDWTLIVKQDGNELARFSGSGVPPASVDLDWNAPGSTVMPNSESPITAELHVTNRSGGLFDAVSNEVHVEQFTLERLVREHHDHKLVSQYDLIMFDFDQSTFNGLNQQIISTYLYKHITSVDSVRITGYTDRTGNEAHNLELSRKRAQSIAKTVEVSDNHAIGVGESVLLYDNNFPEGRFYCRTVNVVVETYTPFE